MYLYLVHRRGGRWHNVTQNHYIAARLEAGLPGQGAEQCNEFSNGKIGLYGRTIDVAHFDEKSWEHEPDFVAAVKGALDQINASE